MLLDTPLCDVGWPAAPFTLADPNGRQHSLSDYQNGRALLVAFICNHCPYVKAIIDRLVADAALLQAEDVAVLAIMPNDYARVPADAPDAMRAFAQQHGFDFPYLIDEDQAVARTYGAVCTPDFFGFNKAGELHYRGRLDDARMGDGAGRRPELLEAMRQIAATGEGPREQQASMGCSIKWR